MEMQTRQQTPEEDALEHIAACKDKPFLEERFIDSSKGRGVFTHQTIKASTFVVEYCGQIVKKKPRPRKKFRDRLKNYLYKFSWKGTRWCIDASKEDKTLGRLVNDDHINPNCEMRKIEYKGTPHLCLFALNQISPGDEITYNYGDSSYPWRSRLVADSCQKDSCSDDEDEKLDSNPKSECGSDGEYELDEVSLSSEEHESDSDYKAEVAASSSEEDDSQTEYLSYENTETSKATSFTKRSYCYVCGKSMAKLARHFLTHADEEPDIAKAFELPAQSKERKRLLKDLRNRGNYKHNKVLLMTNSGDLKPKRCPKKTSNSKTRGKERVLHDNDLAESPLSEKCPSDLQKIILSMQHSEASFIIKHDPLLMQLAQYLLEKHADDQMKVKFIRHKLRQMGNFLLALHGKSIFSFEDAIKPKNFDKVVETVKDIAGFHKKKQRYKKPSVALTLVDTLKEIANVVVDKNEDNEEMVKEAKTFLTACEEQWKGLKSEKEDTTTSRLKVKNPATIPFTHDVQALYRCLETTSASAIETIKKFESPQVYNAFCRVILAQVFVLNKGAPEVSKITLKSFQERGDATQVLSKHFIRINIPNKDGDNVAVLLTSELVNALTLLVSKRISCGVHKDNVFLFAKPDGSALNIQFGRTCLKTFSKLCNAENPEHLCTSHFQKHIARVFQILNLENDELDHLAKLLGHDICTEKEYYRQPEGAVELAKIAQLLLAMEKGSLERFKGKSLDEIDIGDHLEPEVERDWNSKNIDSNGETSTYKRNANKPDSRLTPEQDALKHIKTCKDKPFLEEKMINPSKGRGVFTQIYIDPCTFVVEYRGNICAHKATQKNRGGDALNNFLFDFSWNGQDWSIDASTDDGSLGRLVNDDHTSPNCEIRKIVNEGKPHLCLFALRKILTGEEITFDYGDSSYPWRSTDSSEKQKTSLSAASSTRKERLEDPISTESDCDGLDADDSRSEDDNQRQSQISKRRSIKDSAMLQQRDSHSVQTHSYTNKNYCYVCGKAQAKISRHLLTHKNQDPDIAAVSALRRNSKERKAQLAKLRNRGNWEHNQKVLKTCSGKLKVKRKTSHTSGETLATCIYCKVMCGRKEMWRHLKNCSSKSSNLSTEISSKILFWVSTTIKEPYEMSSNVKKMANMLKDDEVASVVLSDLYLVQLAKFLCDSFESKATKFEYARLKVRQLGRLLLLLMKKSVCSFEEAMKPENFSKVVQAVEELMGFSAESYKAPKFVKLVGSLKALGNIKYAMALKEDVEEETIQEAETFMALCAKQWLTLPHVELKIRNAKTVAFIHDVQLFYQLMERTAASGVQSLMMYESPQVYNALSRVTLAQVTVINNNVLDISTVTLQSFLKGQDAVARGDAPICESQFEQILSKRFVKIKVKNRSGKKVSVMLTPEILSAMMLLVNKREACGVHKNNSYLFARPGARSSSFYRGKTCVTTLVSWSGAKNLSNLKSLYFRKHMARLFHILSFWNDELDQLSNLLGCDIRTDRDYYQTPEAAVDIGKILQLISAVEKGSIEEFQGKSLGEIELEDELQPNMEQNNPESSGDEHDGDDPASPLQRDITKETSNTQTKDSTSEEVTSSKQLSAAKKRASSARKRRAEEADETPDKAVKRSIETPTCRKEDATNISFSDDEEINVDFDLDVDTDEDVRNEEYDGDGNATGSVAAPHQHQFTSAKKRVLSTRKRFTEEVDGTAEKPVKRDTKTPTCRKEDATNVSFSDDEEDMNVDFDIDIDTDDGDTAGSVEAPVITDASETKNLNSSDCDKNDDSPLPSSDGEETTDADTGKWSKRTGVGQTGMDHSCSPENLNTVVEKNKSSDAATGRKQVKIMIHKLEIENIEDPIHISQLSSLSKKRPGKDPFILHSNKKRKTSTSTNTNNSSTDAKAIEMNCSHCKKSITKGQTAYQKKGFTEVFCSKNCLFNMFPVNKSSTKTCHYCLNEITQMLDLVMAVVDAKGSIKDFCSVTCLTSFKSHSLCSMCKKSCTTTCELNINNAVNKFCGSSCMEAFCRDSADVCENCKFPCPRKLVLSLGERDKILCSERCLEQFKKGNVKAGSDSTVNKTDAIVPTACTAESCIHCCTCNKEVKKGQKIYRLNNSQDVFCSAFCFSERHSKVTVFSKTCYNCFKFIKRPQNIILSPVDDSGTMRELCSHTCLASVKSKRSITLRPTAQPTLGPLSECRMCARYSHCKIKLTLEGVVHSLCSDTCLINYSKAKQQLLFTCEMCSSHIDRRLVLIMKDGRKNLCSKECLFKFKEKVQTPQLCLMCQTLHQMSDMVEKEEEDGSLNIFCSNTCMMVYKAPTYVTSEESKPLPQENNVKEVKPVLTDFDDFKVKQEPIGESYKQELIPAVPADGVKDEPNLLKEDFNNASVLSLQAAPKPDAPTLTNMDLPPSCFGCKDVLMNGTSVYQKKGQPEVFCSLPCLMKFYQNKPVKKSCHFCLQVITQPQDVVQTQLDEKGPVKDFCSQACLSSFNYKTFVSTKIAIVPVKSYSQCCMCGRYCISKHEVLQQDVVNKMCSDSCFRRFCNMNKLSLCENCKSHCFEFLTLKMEDGDNRLCNEECLAQFQLKIHKQQLCAMCGTSKLVSDMFGNRNSDDTVELFCSSSCVIASKVTDTSESSSLGSSVTTESSPVITNVVSLAKALAEYRKVSPKTAQEGSLPDIQTKVVGHACIQTDAKEVKNKSVFCTPLVHNKGVSCTVQTVDTEAQTDNFLPKVIILPLPVPVYVPLPMNMYSQFTPGPVGLPLPLPVPMFLPGLSSSSEPQRNTNEEEPGPLGEMLKSDTKTKQNEGENEHKHGLRTREDEEQETLTDPSSSCCDDVKKDHLDQSYNTQQTSCSNTNLSSCPPQHSVMPSVSRPELPDTSSSQSPRSESPASPHLQRSLKKVHTKNKGRKLQPCSETATEDTDKRSSKVMSTKHHRLKCHRGIDVWKRWVQWRESEASKGRESGHAVKAKENILDLSASELNDCLRLFISEVKRPDGKRYSPCSLFYLCLVIQQYLLDNGRKENIFNDEIFHKFSIKFTKILKRYQPSITARGYIHSRVEEEYLWDCKQLGVYSPIVLLNTLLFFCCKYFGFTTVEQHRQLSFAHVMRCTKTNPNNTKMTFLRFYPPITTNEAETDAEIPAKKRKEEENTEEVLEMIENTENPLRCPVRLYEFYLSKCSESVKQRTNLFYLQPERCCVPNSPLWFSSTPLDDSTMEAMLIRILTVRELHLRKGKEESVKKPSCSDPPFIPDEDGDEDSE